MGTFRFMRQFGIYNGALFNLSPPAQAANRSSIGFPIGGKRIVSLTVLHLESYTLRRLGKPTMETGGFVNGPSAAVIDQVKGLFNDMDAVTHEGWKRQMRDKLSVYLHVYRQDLRIAELERNVQRLMLETQGQVPGPDLMCR